ncbi:NADP-dependent oxidoreductase [Streptomyces sp. F8]|nr:NADP-dependent oxidoreductase [Streptomyces sp. F8]MDX6759521.1 NADP-dependent oxidoreductase [Streptomyces sp. F8]
MPASIRRPTPGSLSPASTPQHPRRVPWPGTRGVLAVSPPGPHRGPRRRYDSRDEHERTRTGRSIFDARSGLLPVRRRKRPGAHRTAVADADGRRDPGGGHGRRRQSRRLEAPRGSGSERPAVPPGDGLGRGGSGAGHGAGRPGGRRSRLRNAAAAVRRRLPGTGRPPRLRRGTQASPAVLRGGRSRAPGCPDGLAGPGDGRNGHRCAGPGARGSRRCRPLRRTVRPAPRGARHRDRLRPQPGLPAPARRRRAGGVGHFAVQFARHLGAHVTATASARNLDFLRRLGVDEPVDRAMTDLAASRPFDIVLDTVGGPVQHTSWRLLRPGGTLITLPEPVDETHRLPGIAARRIIVTPDGEALRRIGTLIDSGAVQVEIESVLPLEKAAEAHRISAEGRVRGKLVLSL